jgi:hypothetical protein
VDSSYLARMDLFEAVESHSSNVVRVCPARIVLRRYADIISDRLELPADMVSAQAGLHANQAAGDIGEPGLEPGARGPQPQPALMEAAKWKVFLPISMPIVAIVDGVELRDMGRAPLRCSIPPILAHCRAGTRPEPNLPPHRRQRLDGQIACDRPSGAVAARGYGDARRRFGVGVELTPELLFLHVRQGTSTRIRARRFAQDSAATAGVRFAPRPSVSVAMRRRTARIKAVAGGPDRSWFCPRGR